jgi:RNA polymerase sigma factor (sigma-70 family)
MFEGGRPDDGRGRRSRGTIIAATAVPFAPILRATPETTDHDLVAAVRRGEDQAFERLYERYHRRIAAYIYGMVNDYGRAEDIAQDVFMSALRRMRETDRPIAFKPWIYEIAKNACIDQFRRSRRTEEVSFDAEEGMGAADYGRLVTTGPSPDVAVDTKMSIDHLRGAFGGLSETHHQILVMRELEGLSYREIGERLGMSRPSVESTLFRARRRLSEEYDELVSGERCSRVSTIIVAAGQGDLGTRDHRKLAKHIAHCQPCRRQARIAGVDPSHGSPRAARARIAAFLPLPAVLRRRLEGDDAGLGTSGVTFGHHAPSMAQWSAQLSSTVDPAIAGWAKAAVAAAAVAVAGIGGGTATDDRSDRDLTRPASAVSTHSTPAPAASRRSGSKVQAPVDTSTRVTRTRATTAPPTAAVDTAGKGSRRSGELSQTGSAPAVPGTVQTSDDTAPPVDLPPMSGLPQPDGTDAATGPGRPAPAPADPISAVTSEAPAVPTLSTGATAPTLPGDGGARDSLESTATGVLDGATNAVGGVLLP